jgi:hypothetical protein
MSWAGSSENVGLKFNSLSISSNRFSSIMRAPSMGRTGS